MLALFFLIFPADLPRYNHSKSSAHLESRRAADTLVNKLNILLQQSLRFVAYIFEMSVWGELYAEEKI